MTDGREGPAGSGIRDASLSPTDEIGYRILGSISEADDAVQETWLRLYRADVLEIENLGGWLTTVLARVCLNMLDSRGRRREISYTFPLADLDVAPSDAGDPVHELLSTEFVGVALLVVLEKLNPAERLAFVLHDLFALPYAEIAPIVGRTPAATRQLASRARHRVRGEAPRSDHDILAQRRVVDVFFAAARYGDFEALLSVLDPEVVLRSDLGPSPAASVVLRGARTVAGRAMMFVDPIRLTRRVLVNGAPGVVITVADEVVSLMAFAVSHGKIVSIDSLTDPERLRSFELPRSVPPVS